MSNIITTEKTNSIPLKGMLEEDRADAILKLGDWLEGLLSLDGSKSAKRLEVLLPMIKNSAWGLSIKEIKKAFEYYVEGQLSIEPRDNYLTAILFSKIIKEYKVKYLSKKMNTSIEKSEDQIKKEKEYNDIFMQDAVDRARDQYKRSGRIDKYFLGQYNWLEEKGELDKIENIKELKWKIFQEEKPKYLEFLKFQVPLNKDDAISIKNEIRKLEIEDNRTENSELLKNCKREVLKHYYSL